MVMFHIRGGTLRLCAPFDEISTNTKITSWQLAVQRINNLNKMLYGTFSFNDFRIYAVLPWNTVEWNTVEPLAWIWGPTQKSPLIYCNSLSVKNFQAICSIAENFIVCFALPSIFFYLKRSFITIYRLDSVHMLYHEQQTKMFRESGSSKGWYLGARYVQKSAVKFANEYEEIDWILLLFNKTSFKFRACAQNHFFNRKNFVCLTLATMIP